MARVRVGANWLVRTLQPARAEAAGRAAVMAVAGSAEVAKVAEVRVVAPTAEGGGDGGGGEGGGGAGGGGGGPHAQRRRCAQSIGVASQLAALVPYL